MSIVKFRSNYSAQKSLLKDLGVTDRVAEVAEHIEARVAPVTETRVFHEPTRRRARSAVVAGYDHDHTLAELRYVLLEALE